MKTVPIKLLIADAHAINRNGLAKTLETAPGIQVAAISHTDEELLSHCLQHGPDIVIIGASLCSSNNLQLVQQIATEHVLVKIIVVLHQHDTAAIAAAQKAGAHAWLCSTATEPEIIQTIEEVHAGEWINTTTNGKAINAAVTTLLTNSEKEILQFICLDLTAKEIAAKKGVSPRTVEKHKEHIMQKIYVKSTAGMIIYAVKNNIYLSSLLSFLLHLFEEEGMVFGV